MVSSSAPVVSSDSSVCSRNGVRLVLARWCWAVDWVWGKGEIHPLLMSKAFVKPSSESYLGHVVLQLGCFTRTTGCPCSAALMPRWICLINCPSKQYCCSVKAFKGLALKAGAFSRDDGCLLAEADHTGWRLLCCCCSKQQFSVGYPSAAEERNAWSLGDLVPNGNPW